MNADLGWGPVAEEESASTRSSRVPLRLVVQAVRTPGRLDAASGLLGAARRSGHRVVSVDPSVRLESLGVLLRVERPHAVLRLGPGPSFTEDELSTLRAAGTASVVVRTAAGGTRPTAAPDLRAVVGHEPGDPDELFLPDAVDPSCLAPLPQAGTYAQDVLVVGDAGGRRDWHELVRRLRLEGAVATMGTGWPRVNLGDPDGARRLQVMRASSVHLVVGRGQAVLSAASGAAVVALDPVVAELDPVLGRVARTPDDAAELLHGLLADPVDAARRGGAARAAVADRHLHDHSLPVLLDRVIAHCGPLRRRLVFEVPAPHPRRIVIVPAADPGPLSEAILVDAAAAALVAGVPGAQVVLAVEQPAAALRRSGFEAFDCRDRLAADEEIGRATALVLAGGRLWQDADVLENGGAAGVVQPPRRRPAGTSPATTAALAVLAQVHRRPVFAVSAGAVPLEHPDSRGLVEMSIRPATEPRVRDDASRSSLRTALGETAEAVGVDADAAYSVVLDERDARVTQGRTDGRRVLGIDLATRSRGGAELDDALTAVLRELATPDLVVVGLPQDRREAARLRAVLAAADVDHEVLAVCGEPAQLAADIAACDLLVATRRSPVVLASRTGVRAVAVSDDPAVAAALVEVDRADALVPYDGLSATRLGQVLAEELGAPSGLPPSSSTAIEQLRERASASLGRLADRVLETPPPPEPVVPPPVLDDAVAGRLVLHPQPHEVFARNEGVPDRVPGVRADLDDVSLVLGLEGPAVAGDSAVWSARVPAPSGGAGRRVHVRLRGLGREGRSHDGRAAWQIRVDSEPVLGQDLATWDEVVDAWVGWGATGAEVLVEVVAAALQDGDATAGRGVAVRLIEVRAELWVGGAGLAAGEVASWASAPTRLLTPAAPRAARDQLAPMAPGQPPGAGADPDAVGGLVGSGDEQRGEQGRRRGRRRPRRTRPSPADPELQVYEPHRAGLPYLPTYARDLWARRPFAVELSRATMRAAHSTSVLGQLWLVLNPLLLALVYYLLIGVLGGSSGPEKLVHLVGGLFFFYFVAGCLTNGAVSVVGGGKLVASMAFPRLLMPLSAVRTAFFRFLPTMGVYFVFHVAAGAPWSPVMLLALVFLGFAVVFGAGAAALMAALQVYFRDTASFLPYVVRIWLYLSPVLWFAETVGEQFGTAGERLSLFNPLFSMVGGWTDLLVRSQVPPLSVWVGAAAWAAVSVLVGFYYFLSRERDFAVRL